MNIYYIIVKTVMGKTSIIKFGPVCPDIDMLQNDFSVSYKKIDYKENLIEKEVDKFIKDKSNLNVRPSTEIEEKLHKEEIISDKNIILQNRFFVNQLVVYSPYYTTFYIAFCVV